MADVRTHLYRVEETAARLGDLERRFRQDIADAVASGASLREVAAAAGVSHTKVRRIVEATPSLVTPTLYRGAPDA